MEKEGSLCEPSLPAAPTKVPGLWAKTSQLPAEFYQLTSVDVAWHDEELPSHALPALPNHEAVSQSKMVVCEATAV